MATNEIELQTILQTEPPKTNDTAEAELFIPAEINTDCLGEISNTQQKLSEVKLSLNNIVDSIAQNQSIVSRAAKQWGELPIWQKVAGGVTVTIATLPAALFANVGILLAISGVTLAAYTTGGMILEDHHLCNKHITENLKKGILSLADVLELTINALDKIRVKFNEEIEKFRVQNVKLADNVYLLTEQVESLTNQVEFFVATEKLLRATKEALEKTNQEMLRSADTQAHLIEENKKELEKITREYDRSQAQLSEKIVELGNVRASFSTEVEKSKRVVTTLEGTIQTLAKTVVSDANQREAFKGRLASFISNKEQSLEQFTERMSATEQELTAVKAELVQSNQRYHELLERQEKLVERLEKLNDNVLQEQRAPNTKLAGLLEAKGFYGLKEKKPLAEVNVTPPMIKTV